MKFNVLFKKPKRIFYGWWIVAGATLASAMNAGVYTYGFGAFFDSLVKEFRSTRAVLSGAYSLARLESGILGPIDGMLVDKFGPRKIMLAGVLLESIGFVVLSRTSSITEFYLVFVLIALGSGLGLNTPINTAVGNWFVRRRGIAFGLTMSGIGLGGVLVPLWSWIITQHSWRTSALIAGITLWIVITPISFLMRHKPEQYGYVPDGEAAPAKEVTKVVTEVKKEADFTAREALKTRAFWLLSIAFSIRLMVTSAVPVHIMPFLLDTGFPREIAAAALGTLALISVLGRLGFGWLGDRFEKRYVIAGLLLLLAGSLILLSHVKSLWQLSIFLLLYAPAYGGLTVLMQTTRGEYFGRRAFGTIMGFMAMVIMLGPISGPLFAGYVWDITKSYHLAFTIFAVAAVFAMGLILVTKPPVKKEG